MQLKPCPRCRSTNIGLKSELDIFDMVIDDFGGEEVYSAVECHACKFLGKMQSTEYSAENEWNSRVGPKNTVTHRSEKIFVITTQEG